MKKIVLIGMCLVLVGCGQAPAETKTKTDMKVTNLAGTESYKFCDEGRAIYIFDGVRAGGLAIVENAKECSNN